MVTMCKRVRGGGKYGQSTGCTDTRALLNLSLFDKLKVSDESTDLRNIREEILKWNGDSHLDKAKLFVLINKHNRILLDYKKFPIFVELINTLKNNGGKRNMQKLEEYLEEPTEIKVKINKEGFSFNFESRLNALIASIKFNMELPDPTNNGYEKPLIIKIPNSNIHIEIERDKISLRGVAEKENETSLALRNYINQNKIEDVIRILNEIAKKFGCTVRFTVEREIGEVVEEILRNSSLGVTLVVNTKTGRFIAWETGSKGHREVWAENSIPEECIEDYLHIFITKKDEKWNMLMGDIHNKASVEELRAGACFLIAGGIPFDTSVRIMSQKEDERIRELWEIAEGNIPEIKETKMEWKISVNGKEIDVICIDTSAKKSVWEYERILIVFDGGIKILVGDGTTHKRLEERYKKIFPSSKPYFVEGCTDKLEGCVDESNIIHIRHYLGEEKKYVNEAIKLLENIGCNVQIREIRLNSNS